MSRPALVRIARAQLQTDDDLAMLATVGRAARGVCERGRPVQTPPKPKIVSLASLTTPFYFLVQIEEDRERPHRFQVNRNPPCLGELKRALPSHRCRSWEMIELSYKDKEGDSIPLNTSLDVNMWLESTTHSRKLIAKERMETNEFFRRVPNDPNGDRHSASVGDREYAHRRSEAAHRQIDNHGPHQRTSADRKRFGVGRHRQRARHCRAVRTASIFIWIFPNKR
jgi:hypothetical protein